MPGELVISYHWKGIKNVMIASGTKGAFLMEGNHEKNSPSIPAKAINTTDAGDSL